MPQESRAMVYALLLALCNLLQPELSPIPTQRMAEVTVTVLKDGQPFAGVPLKGVSKLAISDALAITNQEGVATLQVPAPLGEAQVRVFVSPSPRKGEETTAAYHARFAAYRKLLREHTFKSSYVVTLPATETRKQLAIQVSNGLSATMTLVQGGKPYTQPHAVIPVDLPGHAIESSGSQVTVGGLQQGEPAVVFVTYANGSLVRVPIPALQHSTDLGQIDLPAALADATLKITTRNAAELEVFPERRLPGATFIAVDGSRIYSVVFPTHDDERLHNGELPKIPGGSYYVAPFMFSGRKAQVRLIQRVLDGENLTHAQIPRIDAVANQEASLTIDAAQAESEILALPQPK